MKPQRIYNDDAIILKRKNISEADRIVTVFTKGHGRIRLMAKGVRKITSKRSGHIEPFRHVRLSIARGKVMDRLAEVVTVNGFDKLRNDLHKTAVAYYFCELVDLMTAEAEPHENIFELLKHAYSDLEVVSKDSEIRILAYYFSINVLTGLGFLPPDNSLKPIDLLPFIENLTEKKLKTPQILNKIR